MSQVVLEEQTGTCPQIKAELCSPLYASTLYTTLDWYLRARRLIYITVTSLYSNNYGFKVSL